MNLLLVEDNSETLTATAMLLEHLGCEVHRAKDAFEAIELLEGGKTMDIMFSDISLPNGINGLQLARAVRNVWPDISIVLGTGFDISSVKDMAGYQADYKILQKPYDLSHLRGFLGNQIPA